MYTPVIGFCDINCLYIFLSSQQNPIALDWINQNVYWIDTDRAARHIAVVSMQSEKFTRLRQGLNNPVAIAVSPQEGYCFHVLHNVCFSLLPEEYNGSQCLVI